MVIRVSRHGMTRCTSCDRHIRLEAVVGETHCPFCGTALVAPTKTGVLGRTGNALAASLLSFGLGAACLEDQRGTQADTADTASGDVTDTQVDTQPDTRPDTRDPDTLPQPAYGLPMDVVEPAEDVLPQPEYGLPMDVVEPAEDVLPQPEYGLPMDVVEPAEDVLPQPDYGLPMDVIDDTGPLDAKADSDDGISVPLYGLPPE